MCAGTVGVCARPTRAAEELEELLQKDLAGPVQGRQKDLQDQKVQRAQRADHAQAQQHVGLHPKGRRHRNILGAHPHANSHREEGDLVCWLERLYRVCSCCAPGQSAAGRRLLPTQATTRVHRVRCGEGARCRVMGAAAGWGASLWRSYTVQYGFKAC